jgi:hypothetical protein
MEAIDDGEEKKEMCARPFTYIFGENGKRGKREINHPSL